MVQLYPEFIQKRNPREWLKGETPEMISLSEAKERPKHSGKVYFEVLTFQSTPEAHDSDLGHGVMAPWSAVPTPMNQNG